MDKAALKEKLLAEREQLHEVINHIEDWGLNNTETGSVGELSSYDQHPADHGTETFEREKDIALRDNTWMQLRKVEEAINKLESGEYGICERCEKPIPEERLEAIPYTNLCYQCKKEEEEQFWDDEIRPVEERVIHPSYSFKDDFDDYNGFDGEDSWQSVARYGTANTPQDITGAIEYGEVYIDAEEDDGIVEEVDGLIDIRGNGASDLDAFYPVPKVVSQRPRVTDW